MAAKCRNMRFMATGCMMRLCRIWVCHENDVGGIFSLYPGGIFSPSQFESILSSRSSPAAISVLPIVAAAANAMLRIRPSLNQLEVTRSVQYH